MPHATRKKRPKRRGRRRRKPRYSPYTFTGKPTPLRAFLWLTWNASLAMGTAISQLDAGPLSFLVGRIHEIETHNERIADWTRMMVARLEEVLPKQRPHYKAAEIVRILLWGAEDTCTKRQLAEDYIEDVSTIGRWYERYGGITLDTLPSVVPSRHCPPLHRVPDAVRDRCRELWLAGKQSAPGDPALFFGVRLVSRMLAAFGDGVSKSAVHNFVRNGPTPKQRPSPPTIDAFAFVLAALATNTDSEDDDSRPTRDPFTSTGDAATDEARCSPLFDRQTTVASRDLVAAVATKLTAMIAPFEALPEPLAAAAKRLAAVQSENARLLERARLLHARVSRIKPRHRPHCNSELRKDIVAFKARYRLSAEEIAVAFALSRNTLRNWNIAVDTPRKTSRATPLLTCNPPLKTIGDAIERVVAGCRGIADSAAEAFKAACRTLCQRVPIPATHERKTRDVSPSRNLRSRKAGTAIRATRPNHYWMADITAVRPFLRRGHFQIALLIDVHSRKPLAWRAFVGDPTADDILKLIDSAIANYGTPQHFVSDQGPQFKPLKAALKSRGIQHRFGAVGQKGSIAIIERCHRTIKETLGLQQNRTDMLVELLRRLDAGMRWYTYFRPHESLAGATPYESYLTLPPAADDARPATHRPSDYQPAYHVVFALEAERRLPYLMKAA
jgi:transposase InsO family protein